MAKKIITPKAPQTTTAAKQTDDAGAAKTGRLTRKSSTACVKR